MRRRLLLANLALVTVLLAVLEVPLALIYSRHEHDALTSGLQQEAAALASLSGEILEHPGGPDVTGVAQRFVSESGGDVIVVDGNGNIRTPAEGIATRPAFQAVVSAVLRGDVRAGEIDGLLYVGMPLEVGERAQGAVVVARTDEAIDRRVRRFWVLLVLLGAGVLAVSLLLSDRLSRWVADPLRRLDARAAALGRGDLGSRADLQSGPPEVVALAATFDEMADRLDRLVSSQRRFVADASHQLRTPLTALRLRLENLDPEDPQSVASARDASLDEAARLTRLVDGLLALARAEGRRPEREPVDVAAVVRERQDAWAPLADEQGIELVADGVDPGRLYAKLVPGHLEQILDNLINNALDASEPGTRVELLTERRGKAIEVHVVDDGRGMTQAERSRAFDPFWQSPRGHAEGSTGLGLAIAGQLAKACNASIALEPSSTGGVDAVVRIPPPS